MPARIRMDHKLLPYRSRVYARCHLVRCWGEYTRSVTAVWECSAPRRRLNLGATHTRMFTAYETLNLGSIHTRTFTAYEAEAHL